MPAVILIREVSRSGVNGAEARKAKKGDKVTLTAGCKIRLQAQELELEYGYDDDYTV